MARESRKKVIRTPLVERKARLVAAADPLTRSQRAASILAAVRASLPASTLRKRLTRKEEDEILGFGPDGI